MLTIGTGVTSVTPITVTVAAITATSALVRVRTSLDRYFFHAPFDL